MTEQVFLRELYQYHAVSQSQTKQINQKQSMSCVSKLKPMVAIFHSLSYLRTKLLITRLEKDISRKSINSSYTNNTFIT